MNERDFERAAELTQSERDAAIARHRQQMANQPAPRSHCLECETPIPVARQEAVNATLCIECKELKDQLNRTQPRWK